MDVITDVESREINPKARCVCCQKVLDWSVNSRQANYCDWCNDDRCLTADGNVH